MGTLKDDLMSNLCNCPSKIWRSMNFFQKRSYNLYMMKTHDAMVLCPTSMRKRLPSPVEWETIRHNLFVMGALGAVPADTD